MEFMNLRKNDSACIYACGFFLKGVPGNGNFANLEDLIQTVTSVIFICSVGHAASNFPQYDEYAFPLNYPPILRGNPPTDKVHAHARSQFFL